MRALRLARPACTAYRASAFRIFESPVLHRLAPFSSPSLSLSPSLFQKPFSHAAPRQNDWRDPRHHDPVEELRRAQPLFTSQGLSGFFRSPSLYAIIVLSVAGGVAFYFMNIQTVPVSGRRRFNCYSDETVRATGEAQAKRVKYEVESKGLSFLSEMDGRTMVVKQVMERLAPVSGMELDNWEVRVIDNPNYANAFVLPGGKVFVYSGLLPIARDEHGLAAVLSHEMAHNLAQHNGERMSSRLSLNILLYSLVTLTGGLGLIATTVFGHILLDLVFSRPMSRLQEMEADYIGLMMMAEACYDPREAIGFWERMKRSLKEDKTPEWMETHPPLDSRIQKLRDWMPQALEKLHLSDCRGTAHFANLFKQALESHLPIELRYDV